MRALVAMTVLAVLSGCVEPEAGVRTESIRGDLVELVLLTPENLPDGFVVGYEPPSSGDMKTRVFDYTLGNGSARHSVVVGAQRFASAADARDALALLGDRASGSDEVVLSEPDRLVRRQTVGPDASWSAERVFVRADDLLLWAFVDAQGEVPIVRAEALADEMVFRLLDSK